jgi:hypothetical protein
MFIVRGLYGVRVRGLHHVVRVRVRGLHGLVIVRGLHGLAIVRGLHGLVIVRGLHGLVIVRGLHGLVIRIVLRFTTGVSVRGVVSFKTLEIHPDTVPFPGTSDTHAPVANVIPLFRIRITLHRTDCYYLEEAFLVVF